MITVQLAKAMLCVASACHPVLVGDATPTGIFPVHTMHTQQRGYGGDVLLFDREGYAIHRTWPGREHMYAWSAKRRRRVSNGCINVPPALYEQLRKYKNVTITE